MAKNITLMGASYPDVPSVVLPQTGGGTAQFYDGCSVTYLLTGGASANVTPDTVVTGEGLCLRLSVPAGYNLSNVSVTMGGVDITSQVFAYDEDSGGGGTATAHSIYFEFSDSTNTTITAYWDDSFISDAITATTPTTYGQKTVTLAQLDGTTWYEPSQETWETLEEATTNINSDTPYNMIWLSDLTSVYPTAGEVYRITISGNEYRCTAQTAATSQGNIVCVGNPKYSGGSDDGSSIPFNFYNVGWGAWVGDTELPVSSVSVKIERLVS